MKPCIKKARRIYGKNLEFRDATVSDAEFILSLRTDPLKSKHLSHTANVLEIQAEWLKKYSTCSDQGYFIIELDNEPLGTVRMYDPIGESFCWGSWILKSGSPPYAAMESALMVYAYALDHLGFRAAHFDVRKGNKRVWSFHERFGATRVYETDLDYIYNLSYNAISNSRKKYLKFLNQDLRVEFQ